MECFIFSKEKSPNDKFGHFSWLPKWGYIGTIPLGDCEMETAIREGVTNCA